MLNFIARHQDDFILGLFFAVLGAVLGILFGALRKNPPKSEPGSNRSVTMTTIINIDSSQAVNVRVDANGVSNNDATPLAIAILAGCSFSYVYWRQEILLGLAAISILTISFLISSALYSYAIGRIAGTGWTLYLILASAIAIFSFVLVGDALTPTYAPAGLEDFQVVLREQKIGGFLRRYGINTVTWLIPHVFGIFLFLYAQFRLSLSLAHYQAVAQLSSAGGHGALASFVAQATRKYTNPFANGIALTLLSIASYFLINGYVYLWYAQHMTT